MNSEEASTQKFKIRRAAIGDERQIAAVHIRSWQEAYHGLIPQTYLDELPKELDERIDNWNKILTNPKRWAWVAEVSETIVGFVLFGPPRDQNRDNYIELGAIYLLAEKKKLGIGYALLSAGFNFMKDMGYQKAYCWVLEGNSTIRFYERSGAVFLGQTKMDDIAGQDFKELAYEWDDIKGRDNENRRQS